MQISVLCFCKFQLQENNSNKHWTLEYRWEDNSYDLIHYKCELYIAYLPLQNLSHNTLNHFRYGKTWRRTRQTKYAGVAFDNNLMIVCAIVWCRRCLWLLAYSHSTMSYKFYTTSTYIFVTLSDFTLHVCTDGK
jgi:hypothetical protein